MSRKQKITLMCLLILAVIVVMPFFLTCRYLVFSLDDLTNMLEVKLEMDAGRGLIMASIIKAIETYKEWQGSFFGNFFTYFILGIVNLDVVRLRVAAFIWVTLFFYANYCMSNLIVKAFWEKPKLEYKLIVFILIVCTGTCAMVPGEILYWATGVGMYTIPFSFAIIGLDCYVEYIGDCKNSKMIAATILGFLASGGSLQMAALVNVIYLYVVLNLLVKRKITWKRVIPFVMAFIGAVINVIAPGNYVRHDITAPEGIHVGQAFSNTALSLFGYATWFMKHTYILIAVMLFFLFILCIKDEVRKDIVCPVIAGILGILGIGITIFPVVLGYNGSGMPNRCVFLLNELYAFFFIYFTVCVGGWIKEKHKLIVKKFIWVSAIVLVLVCGYYYQKNIFDEQTLVIVVKEQSSGIMNEKCREQEKVLSALKDSSQRKVNLTVKDVHSDILLDMGIYRDGWVNTCAAQLFDKDDIYVEWQ